jgi:tRNA-dihydrouridine synthase B
VNASFGPLRLGGLVVNFPVILAALAGYSDAPYRQICFERGAPFATTEVILDRFLLKDSKLRRRLVRSDEAGRPVAGQIMGNDPGTMARAAVSLRELGYDVIDLNFACPVRKVLSRRRGGFLMTQPECVLEIVHAVRGAVPDRPLTLKLRKSFASADPTCAAFWTIARGAFDAGADGLCVHARSIEQKYSGPADWTFLADVKRAFPDRTIIGSGDVPTAKDALRMLAETGVDGVAVARGAIGNPWIFGQARDIAAGRGPRSPSLEDQRDVLARHYELAAAHYGAQKIAPMMRHFGIAYARLHPCPKEVRKAFVEVRSATDWNAVLEKFYVRESGPQKK